MPEVEDLMWSSDGGGGVGEAYGDAVKGRYDIWMDKFADSATDTVPEVPLTARATCWLGFCGM